MELVYNNNNNIEYDLVIGWSNILLYDMSTIKEQSEYMA